MDAHFTANRREIFAGVVAVATASGTATQVSVRPISELWKEAAALSDATLDMDGGPEHDTMLDRMFKLENAVLRGPIKSRQDAMAKLRSAGLTLERGERMDGMDAPAFEQALSWLEAH